MAYYVYILTNQPNGTLYVGFTNNLARRIFEHREGDIPGFTNTYSLKSLVYFETFEDINSAMQREKTLKKWKRAWKISLIEEHNPLWVDLYPNLQP